MAEIIGAVVGMAFLLLALAGGYVCWLAHSDTVRHDT